MKSINYNTAPDVKDSAQLFWHGGCIHGICSWFHLGWDIQFSGITWDIVLRMYVQMLLLSVGTHSSLFITACQHDQSLYILLPDHPPEIFDCDGQRTLSCNKLLPGVVTLPNKTTAQPHKHKHPHSFLGDSQVFQTYSRCGWWRWNSWNSMSLSKRIRSYCDQ